MAELDLTGENTLESLASQLQSVRTDILYVSEGFLYVAKDLEDLKQDFPLGGFEVAESFLNPNLTWVLIRKNKIPQEGKVEFWFFREDVVKALTGST